jgi:DNA-directed RNA polymerase specialized sigma24 family protein
MNQDPGSITQWVKLLQAGERDAARQIWNRFYPKLLKTASKHFRKNSDPATSGEDIVQSSFRNVFQGVMDGKCPLLANRDELWKLLFVSAINRIRSHYRAQNAQKRPVYTREPLETLDESLLIELKNPEALADLSDYMEYLFGRLDQEDPSGQLRQIACMHLDGHSSALIAKTLRQRKYKVLQKIQWIRILWEECHH